MSVALRFLKVKGESVVVVMGIPKDGNNDLHRRIVESMRQGYVLGEILYDSNGSPYDFRILDVNSSFASMTGISRQGVIGKNIRELVPNLEEIWIAKHAEVVSTGKECEWEAYNDHTKAHYEIYSFRTESHRVASIFTNITDLKERQAALEKTEETARRHLAEIEAIYQNAPVGLCVLDRDLRFLRINERLAEINGPSVEEHLGCSLREVVPAVADAVEPGLRHVLETGEPRLDIEIVATTPARPEVERTWLESWLPVFDGKGEVIGLNLVVQDITDLKDAQQQLVGLTETLERRVEERTGSLEQRTDQLRRLAVQLIEAEERERKRVSSLLHDDLQQLLVAVRMDIQRSIRALGEETTLVEANDLIGQAIQKARALSHELSPTVLEHSGLIASLEWLVRQVGEQFGLAAQLDLDGLQSDGDITFSGKTFAFRAVQELLFNVVKHARVRSAYISVCRKGGFLVIEVEDRGRGFDPDELDRTDGPIGLGLLGLRERAQSIGGHFSVESMPGQGSRFAVSVPLQFGRTEEPIANSAATDSSKDQEGGGNSPDSEKLRIILAEDHRIIRQGLVSVISDHPDIEVVGEASNGREAVDLFRRLRPDVVLMDVSMPIMDGIEATRQIRNDNPRARIIGLSMYEEQQIRKAMEDAGAEAFVNKADTSGELLRAIYGITS